MLLNHKHSIRPLFVPNLERYGWILAKWHSFGDHGKCNVLWKSFSILFSAKGTSFQKLFVSITQSEILYNTIHQVSTRQCKKYWAVAATIFYRIGYIKISNGRQYVTTSARRFHFTVLLKFRLETQLLLNLIFGEMCRVTICESLGLFINLPDL